MSQFSGYQASGHLPSLVVIAGVVLCCAATLAAQMYYPLVANTWVGYLLAVVVSYFSRDRRWVVVVVMLGVGLNLALLTNVGKSEVTIDAMVASAALLFAGLCTYLLLWRELRLQHAFENYSRLDLLTGLNNKKQLNESIARMEHLCERYGFTFSLVLIDVDNLKAINGAFGRKEGDRVLRGIPDVIAGWARDVDVIGRFDDDQFMLLCVETSLAGARQIALRIQEELANSTEMKLPNGKQVTVSMGLAEHNQGHRGSEALLKVLHMALEKAKQDGGNRVVSYPFTKAGAELERTAPSPT